MKRPLRFLWRRKILSIISLLLLCGVANHYQFELAALSHDYLGQTPTRMLKSWKFTAEDQVGRLVYRYFGHDENPFGDTTPVYAPTKETKADAVEVITTSQEPEKLVPVSVVEDVVQPIVTAPPPPMYLPTVQPIRRDRFEGEGKWRLEGLPNPPGLQDYFIAKTFIRPDPGSNASVSCLLMDHRRIRPYFVLGTDDGGKTGKIPSDAYPQLLVAFVGGFQLQWEDFGVVINDTAVVKNGNPPRVLNPRDDRATFVTAKDGTFNIGMWGRDLFPSSDYAFIRQNGKALLVENGQIGARTGEGTGTWGRILPNNDNLYPTWRSGLGLTEYGDLMTCSGFGLSTTTLAAAMKATGAWTAMQLDINEGWVLTNIYFPTDSGKFARPAAIMMEGMPQDSRFISGYSRDFFYVLYDETNYH